MIWWKELDSNQRPPAYRAGALPTELPFQMVAVENLEGCCDAHLVGSKRSLAPLLLSTRQATSPLTPAMRQYLIWAERGKTASETADIVGRKYCTIKNVLSQALERLGCSNKTDAIRLARANGWL